MNLYLHDIGVNKSPIAYKDSLIETTDDLYQVVITNPPFGTRPQGSVEVSANRPEFIKTSDNQVNFLQHIMSIIKTGGRVGVVLPDSVLTDGDATKKVRDKLLKEYNLHTILRLPKGIFYANSVDTNVLFFDKGEPTKDIWVYDYRTGIKHTMATKPMTRENLQEFVECYCSGHMQDRKETYNAENNPYGRWRKYTEDEVKEKGNLNFKWLDFTEEDDRSIGEIYDEIKDTSSELIASVDGLDAMIGNGKKEDISEDISSLSSINQLLDDMQKQVDSLRNKIIEVAVQGKLTEQLPEDGTGEELYQILQAERSELVKSGKIKSDDPLPEIKEEEIPFDIPDNWKWVRLDDIVSKTIKRGKAPKYAESGKALVFAQKCNTKQGVINLELAQYLRDEVYDKYPDEEFMLDGDIVINSTGTGTLGRVGYIQNIDSNRVVPDSHVTIIRVGDNVSSMFAYIYLKYMQPVIEGMGTGSTNQKELYPKVVKGILFPLPPLAEQKRIVEKIDAILSLIA